MDKKFKYYDASAVNAAYKSDVKTVYELVSKGLRKLEKENKKLPGILVWFDAENGGLQGLSVKMKKDKYSEGKDDELDYGDDFFFDQDFMLESVNYLDNEEEEGSEYEITTEAAFAIIGQALMLLHQDGKLKSIVGEYPFSAYACVEDEGENKIFTIFDEPGVLPEKNQAIEAYNQAGGTFDKPTVTQKVKNILGMNKKEEKTANANPINIILENPLAKDEKEQVRKEDLVKYDCLRLACKLLVACNPQGNTCDISADKRLDIKSGGYHISSSDKAFDRQGLFYFRKQKETKQETDHLKKIMLSLIEEGALDKIITHPFEITLSVDSLPKQTILQTKQEGDKIVLVSI